MDDSKRVGNLTYLRSHSQFDVSYVLPSAFYITLFGCSLYSQSILLSFLCAAMHFSGALITLCISFVAHSTAVPSPNTTLLARDTQQFPLEPRGNAISAAKEKLNASPPDGSQSSSGSAKNLLRPKIHCTGNQKVHCVRLFSCTIDGTIQFNDELAPEIGSLVPYAKVLVGENVQKQIDLVTHICSNVCGCEVNGIFRLGGRTRVKVKASKEQKARAAILDKVVREGRRTALDTIPEVNLPVLPGRPSSHTSRTSSSSLIRRDQALIVKPFHDPPPSSSAKTISAPVAHTDSVRKRDGEGQTAETTRVACRGYMKQACERNCRCIPTGQLICDKVQGLEGLGAPENWLRAQRQVMEEYKEDCSPFCSCEPIHSAHKSSNIGSSPRRKTLGVGHPRVVRRGDTENAVVTAASNIPPTKALTRPAIFVQPSLTRILAKRTQTPSEPEDSADMPRRPICSRWDLERKRQCEARCYCNIAGEVKCDTQYPEHFDYLVLFARLKNLSNEAASKMRADQIRTVTNFCVPVCRCPRVPSRSRVPPRSSSAPALSSQESHAGQLSPPSRPFSGASSSLTRVSSLHHRRGESTFGGNTNHLHMPRSPSKVSSSSSLSSLHRHGRPIPKHDPLEPTCQGYDNDYCQLVCNCMPDGSIQCDTRQISHIPAPGQMMKLIFQHNVKLNDYCSTGCKCEKYLNSSGPSGPAASADTGGAVPIPAPRGSSDILSSSNDVVSLHRRGRPMPDPESVDLTVKPICTGVHTDYCAAHCRCTIAGTVKCDMRLGLPTGHVPSEQTIHLILEANRKLQPHCVPICACEKDSIRLIHSAQATSLNSKGIAQIAPSSSHDVSKRASLSDIPRSLSRRGDKKRKKPDEDKLADTATSKYRPDTPRHSSGLGTGLLCIHPRKTLCDIRCICNSMGRVSCSGSPGDPRTRRAAQLALETQIQPQHATVMADFMSKDMEYLTVYCARGCRCGDPSPPSSPDTARMQAFEVEGSNGIEKGGRWGITRDAGKSLRGRPVVG